jgi:2-amino-4-hydroxy-6-hydroxymethyldihydropteridine diphosphokinase
MEQLVLIIGGNQGDRRALLKSATTKLRHVLGKPRHVSSIYESTPWGGKSSGNYLNQVLVFDVDEGPEEILLKALQIEEELGRIRNEKWGNRTMDIDILYYGKKIMELPNLIIPHPFLHLRRFVLVPLVELLPDFIHPKLMKTNQELLNDLQD